MNAKQVEERSGKSAGKTAIQLIVGGLLGYGFILLLDKVVGLKTLIASTSGAGVAAIVMALIFTLIALIVLAMSLSKSLFTYNRIYADMDAKEFAGQRPALRWSAVGMLAIAATLVLLAVAPDGQPQPGYFAAVIGGLAVQMVSNVFLWRRYDELWRQATKDACMVSFCIIETVILIWAAASLFGLGVAFDPLAVVVVSMAIYTSVSSVLVARRGMTA